MKTPLSFLVPFFTFHIFSVGILAQTMYNSPGFDIGTGINQTVTIVMASTRQSDGKILIGGRFGNYNGTPIDGLCRLNVDGSIDNNFHVNVWDNNIQDPYVSSITLLSDGKILIGGTFTIWDGLSRSGLVRLNSDGTIDTTFDIGTGLSPIYAVPYVNRLAVQSDNKIIVVGIFDEYNGIARNSIVRLNNDGSIDNAYNPGQFFDLTNPNSDGIVVFNESLIQPDGKLLLGGSFDEFNGTTIDGFIRLNNDGSIDLPFSTMIDLGLDPTLSSPNPVLYVNNMVLQTDNKIIIAGYFSEINGVQHTSIARLLPTGELDNTFTTSASSSEFYSVGAAIQVPLCMSIQNDGKIIIGGRFDSYDGFTRNNLLRLNSDGTLDYAFYLDDPINPDGSIYTIMSPNDQKLFIGGDFINVQNESRNRLALLDICGNSSVTSIQSCTDYLWADNNTTYTISGTYYTTLTNINGCDSVQVLQLTIPELLGTQEICIVSLDSASYRNRIVWEKPVSQAIDSFYVYKETSVSNVYQQIGATGYDYLGVFIDNNSNPSVQPYRYKVSVVDTCGRETEQSITTHKTIHLTINQGVGNTWNLIWSSYEGINVPSYKIYRGTSTTTMSLLTTVQGNINSYTDLTAVGDVYYQIEFVNPNDCDPAKLVNYNSSKSNIISNNDAGIDTKKTITFILAPNPGKDEVTLYLPVAAGTITFYSLIGAKVFNLEVKNQQETINLNGLEAGMYRVELLTREQIAEQIFIKQ